MIYISLTPLSQVSTLSYRHSSPTSFLSLSPYHFSLETIMFKTQLQEYCRSKAWLLPEYEVTRDGPPHCPRFKGVVIVNGTSFACPEFCKSIKEAHNLAAKFAFEHLAGPSSLGITENSTPASSVVQLPEIQVTSSIKSSNEANRVTEEINMLKGCSNLGITATNTPTSSIIQLPGTQVTFSANSSIGATRVIEDNKTLKDKGRMYKSQLQAYAQKRNLELPVYSVERVGPSHESRFKSKVTVEGKTYESEEFFYTLKEAQCAAAKVALALLVPEGTQEDDPSIYKNLLQEFLQKELSCLPKYTTVQAGPSHIPVFVSTVEIQGETFRGQEAKSKKQAEMNVAKVAYITLKERATTHVTEAPQCPYVNIPVVGTTSSPKNLRVDAQSIPDLQIKCKGATTHVTEAPQCPYVNIPVVGTTSSPKNLRADAQSIPDLQIKCKGEGIEATSNPVTRLPGPTCIPVLNIKKKIIVRPQSSSTSSHDMNPGIHSPRELQNAYIRTLHSDGKWTAVVTENSYSTT